MTFRGKNPPELVTLQLRLFGRLHPACLDPDQKPPCPTCGNPSRRKLPNPLVLDAATLPEDVDVFRLEELPGHILVTERFVDAVAGLGLDGVKFQEMETR